jgi:hypothetical protein
LAAIKRLIALPDALSPRTSTKSVGRLARAGYSIDKLLIERSAAVPLPALLFVPDAATQNKKRPAVLYADGRGKAADAGPGGPIEKLVKAGNIVLSVDLRGYGETTDSLQQSKYRNDEFRTAMLAFHVGRPLVGQRVEDVLAALGVLAAHHRVDPDAIHLVGVERAGPVALHAAAIEPRFASVTLRDSIRSWKDDVVAKPLDANLLGQVVPGALAHYDLPDVAAMLGDRLKAEPSK